MSALEQLRAKTWTQSRLKMDLSVNAAVNFNQISFDAYFTILRLSGEQLILDCIKIEEKYQLNAFY